MGRVFDRLKVGVKRAEPSVKPALGSLVLPVLVSVGVTAAGLAQSGGPATQQTTTSTRVAVAEGVLEGSIEPGGIRTFKGVPFASPPLGALRWKAPQSAKPWSGVRKATEFGARCPQGNVITTFRSSRADEDCLYLNVWTPAGSAKERVPVLVYFHGGNFQNGDGSEPRHDGGALARKGIVTVTVNSRLSLYGFLAHPELTAESSQRSSGNYGLLDQSAALRWVRQNISAFGGNPARVTIAGNSSGSASVSGLMASRRSTDLIAGAIGSAGALIRSGGSPAWNPVSLAEAEQIGVRFAEASGARSISDLRAMPSENLAKIKFGSLFVPIVDGYFLTKSPVESFAAGEQVKVPLLVGWTSHEAGPMPILGKDPPTPANFATALEREYGARSNEALRAYSATTPEEIAEAATNLTSDKGQHVYPTWKWAQLHGETGGRSVYRYLFTHRPPACGRNSAVGTRVPRHGDDIDYAMGNARLTACGAWRPEDEKVVQLLQDAYVSFVKSGNPNGPSLPQWTATNDRSGAHVLYLDINPRFEPDRHRQRYLFLDSIYSPR